ncbi:HNH endonuclease signature motif containing protein [Pedobacter sp.]
MEMEANHITPWHEGGNTAAENCQMLFKRRQQKKIGEISKKQTRANFALIF